MMVILLSAGCKEEVKNEAVIKENTEAIVKKSERKPPSEEEKMQAKSVLSKVMVTPELKTYASFLVSAQLTDLLMREKGPFTVFGPDTEAFNKLDENKKQEYLKLENKPKLVSLLEAHIVEGQYDSTSIVQSIKDGGGTYTLKTLSGATLTFAKEGNDITITSDKGKKTKLGKTDIGASNGIVHVVDVLFAEN